MNRPDREPLTPEERMLADRLARDGSAASPSAALDAAILGAAREAAGAVPPIPQATVAHRRVPSRRRRWPFAAGIAASLALAIGIAWQLRPVPDTGMRAASEMPAAATAPAGDLTRARAMPLPPSAEPAPPPVQADEAPAPSSAPAADAAPPAAAMQQDTVAADSSDAASTAERGNVQAPVERPTAFGADMHPAEASPPAPAAARLLSTPAPVAPAVPPPPPPSPPAPMQAPAEQATRRAMAPAPAPASAAARQAQTESRSVMFESMEDGPDDGDPPASASAPEVRAAWLARVRELLDAGRIADAKASLAEFHRRHPQAELPADLRALLD